MNLFSENNFQSGNNFHSQSVTVNDNFVSPCTVPISLSTRLLVWLDLDCWLVTRTLEDFRFRFRSVQVDNCDNYLLVTRLIKMPHLYALTAIFDLQNTSSKPVSLQIAAMDWELYIRDSIGSAPPWSWRRSTAVSPTSAGPAGRQWQRYSNLIINSTQLRSLGEILNQWTASVAFMSTGRNITENFSYNSSPGSLDECRTAPRGRQHLNQAGRFIQQSAYR